MNQPKRSLKSFGLPRKDIMIKIEASLAALLDHKVQFVVIGGVAMFAQGSPHLTQDLDICYERSRENLGRVVEALGPYHPQLRGAPAGLPFSFDVETVHRGLNFTLSTDLGDIDLLGEVAGLGFYPAVRAASVRLNLFGQDYNVLSLEGLIQAKKAAGRPRDLEAVPELEAMLNLEQESGDE